MKKRYWILVGLGALALAEYFLILALGVILDTTGYPGD